MTVFGYARVSTQEQDLDLQEAALRTAGCERIFSEKVSGAGTHRAELGKLLGLVERDDILVVTRLDRLARSTLDMLTVVMSLDEQGVKFRSLAEPWADTTSAAGKMVMTIFAGMAEFERALILERTAAGRVRAMAEGVRFGRPPALTHRQQLHALDLLKTQSVAQVADLMGVGKSTIQRVKTASLNDDRVRLK